MNFDTGIGFPSPLFFIGVVENNEDPRLEGRVQVRAFGIHGTNKDIATQDLPWATLIIGSHDVNFVVPPLNAWVFGFFIDGRDAQQPMILGLIPTQFAEPIDPEKNGWGVALGQDLDRGAMGSRHQDIGQPPLSRLARGENLEETYNLALETNRRIGIEIAGGAILDSVSNRNLWSGDEIGGVTPYVLSGTEKERIAALDSDPEFQSELNRITQKYGVSREQVYGIIAGESSYDPSVINSAGYAGFFQFGKSALSDINARNGTNYTTDQISKMTPSQQLRVYDQYLERWNFKNSSGLGIMQAAPGFASKPGNTEVYAVGTKAWQQNPGWRGPDGKITVDSINAYYNRKNPPPANETASDLASTPDQENTYNAAEEGSQITVSSSGTTTTWDEPSSGYMAQYPYNRVLETPGGHVIEVDSTQGAERIMVWHPNGSYMQMTPTTNTYKSTKDHYGIHEQNHHIYIGGKNILTIEGDCHVLVKGNKIEEIRGDYKQIVHGNISIGSGGQIGINGSEETQIRSARLDLESNVENLNLRVGKKIVISSGESLHLKSKGVFIQGTESLNLKGENIFTEASSEFHFKGAEGSIESAGNLSLKADHALLGGGQLVSVNADLVVMDDIVQLGNGQAGYPIGAESATNAEEATDVEMETPPSKDISLTNSPSETSESSSTKDSIRTNSDISSSPALSEDELNDLNNYQIVGILSTNNVLIKLPSGEISDFKTGDKIPNTDYTVSSVSTSDKTVSVRDSDGRSFTLEDVTGIAPGTSA